MKKSLIAIAIMTVAGTAAAQSSLNLYGVADIWVGKYKTEPVTGAKGKFRAGTDGVSSSRIGFKGSEDLGGGLKANFNFEQYVNLASGATNNPAAATGQTFDRQANVGFSSDFGTLKLGRSFTAFDDIHGAANSGFDSALSATTPVWVGYTSSANAQIHYTSPEIGGLSGAASFTLKGNQSSAAADPTNDVTGLHLKYSSGPIYAGVAYQSEKVVGAPTIKHTLINGSYDLGMAKLLASYRSVSNTVGGNAFYGVFSSRKADEFQVGVDVPVSSQLTVSAGYASSKLKGKDTRAGANPTSGSIRNSVGYSLAAGYSLSKRTMLYGGFNASKTNNVKNSLVAAGVNHSF